LLGGVCAEPKEPLIASEFGAGAKGRARIGRRTLDGGIIADVEKDSST
jgi:hypothetical protein